MTKEATLVVPAIHCSSCADTIRRNLEPIPGVESVVVDPESKIVDLRFEESVVTEEQIREKLEEIGFFPDE
ncbi:MAG: heavy-metal-associated domain-containing protein [Chloroflexi bacterium]|nr:heavy-metal-associated domain-containing protein [Chloroflexota bacterium]